MHVFLLDIKVPLEPPGRQGLDEIGKSDIVLESVGRVLFIIM